MNHMDFSNRIYKYLKTSKVLEVGEVKIHKAYLYAKGFEVFITTLPGRKVVAVEVRTLPSRDLVFSKTGTVSAVLNGASGYIQNRGD